MRRVGGERRAALPEKEGPGKERRRQLQTSPRASGPHRPHARTSRWPDCPPRSGGALPPPHSHSSLDEATEFVADDISERPQCFKTCLWHNGKETMQRERCIHKMKRSAWAVSLGLTFSIFRPTHQGKGAKKQNGSGKNLWQKILKMTQTHCLKHMRRSSNKKRKKMTQLPLSHGDSHQQRFNTNTLFRWE